LVFSRTGFVTVRTRKDDYTKPRLLCQGDLTLFGEQFRRFLPQVAGLLRGPFL
jgi:hypothetical protein